jgi:hypothetical protein
MAEFQLLVSPDACTVVVLKAAAWVEAAEAAIATAASEAQTSLFIGETTSGGAPTPRQRQPTETNEKVSKSQLNLTEMSCAHHE